MDEVRIGDEEREGVTQVLARHLADGRLTLGEYEDRLDVVYAARVPSELAPALSDLPPLPAPAAPALVGARAHLSGRRGVDPPQRGAGFRVGRGGLRLPVADLPDPGHGAQGLRLVRPPRPPPPGLGLRCAARRPRARCLAGVISLTIAVKEPATRRG